MHTLFRHTTWLSLLVLIGLVPNQLLAQQTAGGQIQTIDSYLYGRFEVVMQSAAGSGLVSSFFLYNTNVSKTCTWPEENNEIDIEMTGNNNLIYFTTHHPHPVQPWFYGDTFDMGFNPHTTMQRYAFEWEPGIVRWFVEDSLIYVQNDQNTDNLEHPMAIMMNLWASPFPDWTGPFNIGAIPQQSRYDQVRYYRHTPGEGNAGTSNNFTLEWEDNFDFIDLNRWEVSEFRRFNDLTAFRASNVTVENGILALTIDVAPPNNTTVPVTFSVNMAGEELEPDDVVYLNSTYNEWCGNCEPMIKQSDDVWTVTVDMPPGRYEYLFTVNVWEEIGNAPITSSCDYNPCDEYGNYGIVIPEGSPPVAPETVCWNTCNTCFATSIEVPVKTNDRQLIGIYDLLGREASEQPGQVLIYRYDDGSVERKLVLRERQ